MKTAFAILLAASCTISSAFAQESKLNSYPTKPTVAFVFNCTQAVAPRLFNQGFPQYQAGFLAAETCACLMDMIRKNYTFAEFQMMRPDQSFSQQDIIDCIPNNFGEAWNYSTSL
jgi:hypothetical protein